MQKSKNISPKGIGRWIVCLFGLSVASVSLGQEPEQFAEQLQAVEKNSPHIAALKARMEAQQIDAGRANVLADPEVEFEYYWGDPAEIGKTKAFGVSQSFEFPTTYLHRRNASRQAKRNAALQYQADRQALLLQAQQLCVEMVYYNASIEILNRRLESQKILLQGATRRLQEGEMTRLDYNRLEADQLMCASDLAHLEAEREAVAQELVALNGGHPLSVSDKEYTDLAHLPATDFESWWQEVSAQSPMLQYVAGEVERAKQEVRVARSGWGPQWSVGYVSEYEKDEIKRGFSVGLSIPLWSNRGKVKQAKAELAVAENEAFDQKLRFMSRLRSLFDRAQSEMRSVRLLKEMMEKQNTLQLLAKAYEEGELSQPDYQSELISFYEQQQRLIEDERDLRVTLAELMATVRFR